MRVRLSMFMFFLGCAVLIAGCTSKIAVREISYQCLTDKGEISGVPMQFAARHQITVFAKRSDGGYSKVYSTVYAMPEQNRVFGINVDSKPLANNVLTLGFNDNGTPNKVALTNSSQAAAALSQLGTSASAIAVSAATYEQQRQKAAQSALEQQQALEKLRQPVPSDRPEKLLAYRKALEAVLVQQAKVENLPEDTKKEVRVAEESNLRVLKLVANEAARAVPVPVPYPNVEQPPIGKIIISTDSP